MDIKLTKLIAGADGVFQPGTILQVTPEIATELIAAKAAIAIETPETAPEPETAVIKTRRQKR